jgi:hypothetical protein
MEKEKEKKGQPAVPINEGNGEKVQSTQPQQIDLEGLAKTITENILSGVKNLLSDFTAKSQTQPTKQAGEAHKTYTPKEKKKFNVKK